MLKHILGKMNMKADILSRKDQVNTKEDNKDVQLLKEELWQQRTTAEITMIKRKTTVKEGDILREIKKKHNKRERSCSRTEERGWFNLGRRWSGVHGRKNLCIKEQKD